MNSNKQNKQNNSDDQLNEQINKKLRQLWSDMKNKKKHFLSNLTPSYSRKTQNTPSQVNISTNYMIRNTNMNNPQNKKEKQLKLKQSQIKNQCNQLQVMKKTIQQLKNQNKTLISQLQSFNQYLQVQNYQQQQKQKQQLNQSSIRSQKIQEDQSQYLKYKNKQKKPKNSFKQKYNNSLDMNKLKNKKSANNIKNSSSISKNNKVINKCNNSNKQTKFNSQNRLKKSISIKQNKSYYNSKSEQQTIQQNIRLIQLLKSTSQYRQFAYYYDSHQLSYLKRLQTQHNNNCPHNISKKQKKLWGPTDLINQMKKLNKKQSFNLTQKQIQIIISQMKGYFQQNEQSRMNKVKEIYKRKILKLQREKENKVAYDVVRLINANDRMAMNSYQNKKQNKSKSIRS